MRVRIHGMEDTQIEPSAPTRQPWTKRILPSQIQDFL